MAKKIRTIKRGLGGSMGPDPVSIAQNSGIPVSGAKGALSPQNVLPIAASGLAGYEGGNKGIAVGGLLSFMKLLQKSGYLTKLKGMLSGSGGGDDDSGGGGGGSEGVEGDGKRGGRVPKGLHKRAAGGYAEPFNQAPGMAQQGSPMAQQQGFGVSSLPPRPMLPPPGGSMGGSSSVPNSPYASPISTSPPMANGMKVGGVVRRKTGGGLSSLKLPNPIEKIAEREGVIRGTHHNYPKFRKESIGAKVTLMKKEGGEMKDCKYKKGGPTKKAAGGEMKDVKQHKRMALGEKPNTMKYAEGGSVRGMGMAKSVPHGKYC